MRKLAVLSAVALVGFGSLADTTDAEARSRRNTGTVVAAGVAGLAVGGLVGAAASNAYAAPAYGYSYPAYGSPSYGYAPVTTTRVVRTYDDYDYPPHSVYRTTRVVRYSAPVTYGYGYAPARYGYSWGGPAYSDYGW
ncbi:hypothetical protein [Microvirga lotononidis]|uniref:Uncharacterized protein n=1 Tax=Microvirga lotononidis TaxID=864069 RepID=I4YSF1_9HYPH|nr:hypothetical protein [Microvirga lotononidis]EIM26893.1 hypothetical protein MicloDRAFT_00034440 [Microvirga lotononidis]WQO31444.1 hypothetical protein U0023_34740 [Microvirga lotononidis]